MYEKHNGATDIGIGFEYYSIEKVEQRPEQDIIILSVMQEYYPELAGDLSEYSCLGSWDALVGWFHKPTDTIFICHGGESLSVYRSVKEWLLAAEQELKWSLEVH